MLGMYLEQKSGLRSGTWWAMTSAQPLGFAKGLYRPLINGHRQVRHAHGISDGRRRTCSERVAKFNTDKICCSEFIVKCFTKACPQVRLPALHRAHHPAISLVYRPVRRQRLTKHIFKLFSKLLSKQYHTPRLFRQALLQAQFPPSTLFHQPVLLPAQSPVLICLIQLQ
jgi:hypothetical protein